MTGHVTDLRRGIVRSATDHQFQQNVMRETGLQRQSTRRQENDPLRGRNQRQKDVDATVQSAARQARAVRTASELMISLVSLSMDRVNVFI